MNEEYVSFKVAGQLLGIPVAQVQEILPPQPITKVPTSHKALEGLLNLRGQIVTSIDLRKRLNLPHREEKNKFMNIIVNGEEELFSLIVDTIGEVLVVPLERYSPPPPTLDPCWQSCCQGVIQLEASIMFIIDVEAILSAFDQKVEIK